MYVQAAPMNPTVDIVEALTARWRLVAVVVAVIDAYAASMTGAIDGAFLGGVAAILSTVFTFVLGLLAYRRGHRNGHSKMADEADAWRLLAEAREREIDRLNRSDAGQ